MLYSNSGRQRIKHDRDLKEALKDADVCLSVCLSVCHQVRSLIVLIYGAIHLPR